LHDKDGEGVEQSSKLEELELLIDYDNHMGP